MSEKEPKQLSRLEKIYEMREKGTEVLLDDTDRLIRLRTLDAPALLKENKMPDILTPLVVKMMYNNVSDEEVRGILRSNNDDAKHALDLLDTMEFVARLSIADGTKVEDLTLGEKRWIFRLALQPAELLINFRYDENAPMEFVDESEDILETA